MGVWKTSHAHYPHTPVSSELILGRGGESMEAAPDGGGKAACAGFSAEVSLMKRGCWWEQET